MTMTKEEAIKTLNELLRETNDPWYEEVYNMAIEALQDRPQGRWEFDEDEGEYVCSECKRVAEIDTITGEWILSRYCGDCGAYMVNHSTVYER